MNLHKQKNFSDRPESHCLGVNNSTSFPNKLQHSLFQAEEWHRGCHCHHVWLWVLQKSQWHSPWLWTLDVESQRELHTSGCWTAGDFHMYLIQEIQQQGLYMVIKRSSMVNQKLPRNHLSLLKTQERGLLQSNSLVRNVLYAETWPVSRLVLFANKSLTEEKDTVTCFWEVRLESRSTESTFALAGRGGVP